jgi:hypothetical protein
MTKILMHYGGRCSCCGYDNLDTKVNGMRFLEISGPKAIRDYPFYLALWRNKPTGYRVLCRSCRMATVPGDPICVLHRWEIWLLRGYQDLANKPDWPVHKE